ncbi:hypothetical protein CR513_15860, partial [Mucuna pruriens]
MSLPTSTLASTQHAISDLRRPCASFAPSIWGDTFLQYASDESMNQLFYHILENVKMVPL